MQPYERLLAWQACHDLNLAVARETDQWPRTERFELTSQVRRAAWSAVANLVEGSARKGPREFRRFLDIALGSLAELGYGLRFARDRAILPVERYEPLEAMRASAARLTWLLHRSMRTATSA
jgi:four helix bundle protein